MTRNYHKHVIEETVEKVSSMSMDDALKPTFPQNVRTVFLFIFMHLRVQSFIA